MITLQTCRAAAMLASATLIGLALPALAQPTPAKPPAKSDQCFSMRNFESWRAVDSKTMYVRARISDIYRVDMVGECPELTYPDAHLITVTRGSDQVCGPLDWDLKVADGVGPGSFATPCLVKSQTRLTPEEAKAIPKKFQP
jgi:hypothetical protein